MWRKSKVIYQARIEGENKTQTEVFLHESISLGDVENQCAEHLSKRIRSGIEMVDSAAKVKFTHVIFYGMQEDDRFYEVKLGEWDGAKKYTYTYLLPAIGPEQVLERMTDFMGTSAAVWRLLDIKESDILAVWNASSELWTGDWHNRQDRLYDEGKFMPDANTVEEPEEEDPQLSIFDDTNLSTKTGQGKAKGIVNKMLKKMKNEGTIVSYKGPGDDAYRPLN